MQRKALWFLGLVVFVMIISAYIFDKFSQPSKPSSSLESNTYATAAIIDMDLEEDKFNLPIINGTTLDKLSPILALVNADAPPQPIRNLAELLALDTNKNGIINAADSLYYQLGVLYFKDNKPFLMPLNVVGIRGILLDPKLIQQAARIPANFIGHAGTVILSDNSKRPIIITHIPNEAFEAIR